MIPLRRYQMTVEEYLTLERANDARFEYLGGHVTEMMGSTISEALIYGNLLVGLGTRIDSLQVFTTGTRLKVPSQAFYTHADLSVITEAPQFEDEVTDTLLNPTIIIEVLSPYTETYDRGKKFHRYQDLQSLQVYLLVHQDEAHVECFRRQGAGWYLEHTVGIEANLKLPIVEIEIPFTEIYYRVSLDK
ncbi:MAG: Uma2 family endonuclease [Phototrophicaceae bacterium]|jgi:Uma2 family endonuclease